MKSLVKLGIFAFAFGLFATACNSGGNQNDNSQEPPAMEEQAPSEAQPPAATPDSLNAVPDSTNADTSDM